MESINFIGAWKQISISALDLALNDGQGDARETELSRLADAGKNEKI